MFTGKSNQLIGKSDRKREREKSGSELVVVVLGFVVVWRTRTLPL